MISLFVFPLCSSQNGFRDGYGRHTYSENTRIQEFFRRYRDIASRRDDTSDMKLTRTHHGNIQFCNFWRIFLQVTPFTVTDI